jgi:ubiquinone/menaquinone biosynthesis C-methylase UbiE
MEKMRKSFQGVTNIIRFNWHFYVLSAAFIFIVLLTGNFLNSHLHLYTNILCILIITSTLVSLLTSFYVYDLSELYTFKWLDKIKISQDATIVNINAGFDETSILLSKKYPSCSLQVLDFYDPEKHTEISIKRARKAYPPYKNTVKINTSAIPLEDGSADNIFVILSAHEIRNGAERIIFFKELNRILNPLGKIIVTEHLRNVPNFFAYNIGFFHFLSASSWHKTFNNANFKISYKIKITPFITTFILEKNGNTL